jgi:hypothetical protein
VVDATVAACTPLELTLDLPYCALPTLPDLCIPLLHHFPVFPLGLLGRLLLCPLTRSRCWLGGGLVERRSRLEQVRVEVSVLGRARYWLHHCLLFLLLLLTLVFLLCSELSCELGGLLLLSALLALVRLGLGVARPVLLPLGLLQPGKQQSRLAVIYQAASQPIDAGAGRVGG